LTQRSLLTTLSLPYIPWSFLPPSHLPLHCIPILHQKLISSLSPSNNQRALLLFRPRMTTKPHFPPIFPLTLSCHPLNYRYIPPSLHTKSLFLL
jgi:hypothetical protein